MIKHNLLPDDDGLLYKVVLQASSLSDPEQTEVIYCKVDSTLSDAVERIAEYLLSKGDRYFIHSIEFIAGEILIGEELVT